MTLVILQSAFVVFVVVFVVAFIAFTIHFWVSKTSESPSDKHAGLYIRKSSNQTDDASVEYATYVHCNFSSMQPEQISAFLGEIGKLTPEQIKALFGKPTLEANQHDGRKTKTTEESKASKKHDKIQKAKKSS